MHLNYHSNVFCSPSAIHNNDLLDQFYCFLAATLGSWGHKS